MLYVVEAGFASFGETETANLREYLNRGGFLMVDDFHGSYQWEQFSRWIGAVFPDRDICLLPSQLTSLKVMRPGNNHAGEASWTMRGA